jgi:hypothetical protein
MYYMINLSVWLETLAPSATCAIRHLRGARGRGLHLRGRLVFVLLPCCCRAYIVLATQHHFKKALCSDFLTSLPLVFGT